jgi:hypothetical protein
MSEFEPSSQGAPGAGVAELQEDVNSLRMLLSWALILLIVFCGSTDLYLLKQVSSVQIQIKVAQDYLDAETRTFNTAAAIETWNRLVAYARTHPEYAAVLNKYRPALGQTLLGGASEKE